MVPEKNYGTPFLFVRCFSILTQTTSYASAQTAPMPGGRRKHAGVFAALVCFAVHRWSSVWFFSWEWVAWWTWPFVYLARPAVTWKWCHSVSSSSLPLAWKLSSFDLLSTFHVWSKLILLIVGGRCFSSKLTGTKTNPYFKIFWNPNRWTDCLYWCLEFIPIHIFYTSVSNSPE